jgi:tetratricopeptide (TPR) repeat protein
MGFEAEQRMFVTGFSLHMHDLVGDLDDVDERFEALIRRQPDPFSESIVCTQAIAGAAARGDWERAVRYGRRGMAADPDVVFTFWGSGLQMNLGSALMNIGHGDEGWPLFRDGRERYAQIGTRTSLGNYLSAAGVGLLRLGRVDEAATVIGDARRELETYQERWPEPVILVAEAELAHARGEHERARRLLDQAEAVATEQGSHGIARRAERTREKMQGS